MEHYITVSRAPAKLAILPGAFNPPTRAHLDMADAALARVDEVLFALPRAFPHKEYTGSQFETRLEWLRAALAGYPRFSLAVTEGGLFIEIAQEAAQALSGRRLCRVASAVHVIMGQASSARICSEKYCVTWRLYAADPCTSSK